MVKSNKRFIAGAIILGTFFVTVPAIAAETEQESAGDEPVVLQAYVYRVGLLRLLNFQSARGVYDQTPLIQTSVRYHAPVDLASVADIRNFRITMLKTDTGVVIPVEDINLTHGTQQPPTRLDTGAMEYRQGFSVRLPSITTTYWSVIRAEVDLVLQAGEPLSTVLPPFKEIQDRTIRVLRPDGQAIHLRAERRTTTVGRQTQIQIEMSDEDWQWIDSITTESRHGIPIAMDPRGQKVSGDSTARYYGISQKSIDDLRLRLRVYAQKEVVDGILEIRNVPLPSLLFLPDSDGPALREAPE